MKIQLHVKLYATLSKFSTGKTLNRFELETGATVAHLLEELDIPLSAAKLVFVNGKKAPLSAVLKDGERVGIFPPVGGG